MAGVSRSSTMASYQTASSRQDQAIWIKHIASPFNDQRWSSATLAEENSETEEDEYEPRGRPSEPREKPQGGPPGPPAFGGGPPGGKPGGKPDPNVIDWDGPNDPDNPMNYGKYYKMWITFLLSMLSLAATLGSSIISPAEGVLSNYFGISGEVTVLGISLYM
jgi:DHA1 family multidrug resistance protein-like MFS transporter